MGALSLPEGDGQGTWRSQLFLESVALRAAFFSSSSMRICSMRMAWLSHDLHSARSAMAAACARSVRTILGAVSMKISLEKVNENLAFLRMNKSDLSRDLVKPAIEVVGTDGKTIADDSRARRPRTMQAVQLAQRYLDLFALNGVKEKPSFRIDDLPGLTPGTKPPYFFILSATSTGLKVIAA